MTAETKFFYCTYARKVEGLDGQFHCINAVEHGDKGHYFRMLTGDADIIDKLAKKASIYDAEQEFTQACKDAVDGKRGPFRHEELDAFRARGVSMEPTPKPRVKR